MNARQRRRERRQLVPLVGQPVHVRTVLWDGRRYRRAWRGGFGLAVVQEGAVSRLACVRGDDMHECNYRAGMVKAMP